MIKFIKKITKNLLFKYGWKLIKLRNPPNPNPYGSLDEKVLNSVNNCSGILHLGAHRGLEAEVYNWFGKNVVWVEALPEIYEELVQNLHFYKNQKSFLALLTDKNNQTMKFNISNHDKACSSIFEFTENIKKSKIWSNRNHAMIKSISLKSITLDTLLEENQIDANNYNHWILDLQGAELLALKGGEKSLEKCNSLYIEVSTKNFYKEAVLWNDIKEWLITKNFYPTREPGQDEEDILFIRNKN